MAVGNWRSRFLMGGAAVAFGLGSSLATVAQAIQLADGTVYFAQAPRLLKARTTFNSAGAWGATYYFTLQVPADAGEPLQRLVIKQREGPDTVRFDLDDTRVFETENRQQRFTLGAIEQNRRERNLSMTFDPPIPPGQGITVGLRPYYNPAVGGVYLFGVTAFPAGEKAHGQFLGFGRLHFYDRHDSFFPFGAWRYRPWSNSPFYRHHPFPRYSPFDPYGW